MSFSPYFRLDGKPVVDFRISSNAYIFLNNPYTIAGTPAMDDICSRLQKVADFHGHPIYRTNRREVTIPNSMDRPLFVPVAREDFIHTVIAYREHKLRKDGQQRKAYTADTDATKLRKERDRRRQDFDSAYKELLRYDRNAAEELRKTIQETIDPDPAAPLDENGTTGADVLNHGIEFSRTQIRQLREELAQMNPEEKRAQAHYSPGASERYGNVSGLLPTGRESEGELLVRIHPDLVDQNPRKIQLVSIQ